jgi:O-antigen/teichoic acid export membrane protein
MGTQYLGLSSLFTSILSFLSLTELGVGAAMVYSMYKPIAENDHTTIRALLNLYKKVYRVIGTLILALGLALMPFLKILVPEQLPPDINLYLLYAIYLFNAVLSYWLFAYKNALLQAYQRSDLDSIIASIITPVSYVVMLVCLFLTKNYYAYVIWLPVFTVVTNFLRMFLVNRNFPDLEPAGDISPELKKSIFKKTTALIGTKLNTVVLNAADNLVMSAFLGLTAIAMYGNYHYIMSSIIGFLGIAYSSMTAGLGNSLQTESFDTNYLNFEKFSFINSWLVGWCTVCLVCLYQPFMTLWVGQKLMFPFYVVLELGLYFYIYQIRKIPVVYKDAAGIWWEDRFRPYVCMVVNLVLNIILVQIIGISGIILSTVFSLFISIPWENYTIFKYVFHRSSKNYYAKMFLSAGTMLLSGGAAFGICSMLGDSIPAFLLKGCVCLIVPNVIFALLNCKRPEFRETVTMAKRILKKQY